MADAAFADPRLAEIYDPLDPDRSDLDVYAAMAQEFGARSVLDVGCGTGTLACLLAARGLEVIAVDPAAASLDVARRKPGAGGVGLVSFCVWKLYLASTGHQRWYSLMSVSAWFCSAIAATCAAMRLHPAD